MKRIEINLYPHKDKDRNKLFFFLEKYFSYVFLAAIGFVALNIILSVAIVILSLPLRRLNSEWTRISPQAERVDSLKKEYNTLKGKQKSYEDLLTYKIDAAHILGDLFESLPAHIWLSELRLNDKTIMLSGYAVHREKSPYPFIDSFIKNIEKASYVSGIFNQVTLKNSKKVNLHGRETIKFEIECSYAKDQTR